MRADLRHHAVAIARNIDPQLVKKLAFTADDAHNPAFEQLRAQLVSYQRLTHCRGIYTLALRDGELVFGPESYDPSDPQASPPGTVYRQPTAEMRAVFRTGRVLDEGPISDEYGTFVSASVPVLDPGSGDVLLVVGLDIEAREWWSNLRRIQLTAVLCALPPAFVLLMELMVLRRRAQRGAGAPHSVLYGEAYLTAALGLTVTVIAALGLHRAEAVSQLNLFQQLAGSAAERLVECQAGLRDAQLGALVRLYAGSHDVQRHELCLFADSALFKNGVATLAWAPAVPAGRREAFESQVQAEGLAHFGVWEQGSNGQRQPVSSRATYFPVLFAEPMADNEAVLGFDLGSEQARRKVLEKATVSRLPALSGSLLPVHPAGVQEMLAIQPVYDDEHPHVLEGFALAAVRLDSLLRSALTPWEFDQTALWIDLYGLSPDASLKFLASTASGTDQTVPRAITMDGLAAREGELRSIYPLFVFDQCYAVVFRAAPSFLADRPVRTGVATAAVGALLTALCTLLVVFVLRRRADLTALVEERTRQLQLSERRTRAITDAAQDAIIMLDASGCVSFWNPAAERTFGYSASEVLGENLHRLLMPSRYRRAHDSGFSQFTHTGAGAAIGRIVALGALRKDGTEIAIELSLSAVQIDGGWHAIGIVRDVTEQKRNEEQLRKMQRVVEQTPVSVVITDLAGAIEYVNPAFCSATGYTAGEAVGQNPRILKSGLQSAETYAHLWRELSAGREWRGEFQNRRKNGELYWELAVISPLKDATGKVTHYLGVKEDISVRKALEDELRSAAQVDKLTGLPNRVLLSDRLQQAIIRARRHKDYHFAVLFLDFDRFKVINDSLGHEVGDQLLQEIAVRLQALVRTGDTVNRCCAENTAARLGGDEFVVLLDGIAHTRDAQVVADRLIQDFSKPYQLGPHRVHSTASIGIVTSDMPAQSAADVLRDADTAMYEAKLNGKSQYAIFDVTMRQRVQHRLHLESDLRIAVEAGQLFLMYQPIVCLQSGEIASYEALIRWRHPERGLIMPAEFIPIAEETGLILSMSEWILREACSQHARWREQMKTRKPFSIAVNLSRAQLAQPDLPQIIQRILRQADMDPGQLHLEVTESAVVRDIAAAVQMLHAIKAIGVKLAMDDFGTGYSSLACLHQFPIDELKIDRSFVTHIDRGQDFAALVHAVAHLAHNLKISVVAEGIETVEQLAMLQSLECPFGQGYLLGRPLLAEDVPSYRVPAVVASGGGAAAVAGEAVAIP